MGLREDAERNRLALIDQLYDQWRGRYMLRVLRRGKWIDVSTMHKLEAIEYQCKPDESLGIIDPGQDSPNPLNLG